MSPVGPNRLLLVVAQGREGSEDGVIPCAGLRHAERNTARLLLGAQWLVLKKQPWWRGPLAWYALNPSKVRSNIFLVQVVSTHLRGVFHQRFMPVSVKASWSWYVRPIAHKRQCIVYVCREVLWSGMTKLTL